MQFQLTLLSISDEDLMLSIQTHIMGPFRVIKAALPYMRAQNSGTLAFHGSCLGMRPYPAQFGYSSMKAAGDMLHEILRLELKTFNIRTLIINSGLFHSNILTNAPKISNGMSEHYVGEGTVLGACLPYFMQAHADPLSMMPGDPEKWGERVLEVIDKSGKYGGALSDATRLLLGQDSILLADSQVERIRREIDRSREIAASTDFEGTKAIGMAHIIEIAP